MTYNVFSGMLKHTQSVISIKCTDTLDWVTGGHLDCKKLFRVRYSFGIPVSGLRK